MTRLIDGYSPEFLENLDPAFLTKQAIFVSETNKGTCENWLRPEIFRDVVLTYKLCFNCEQWNDRSNQSCSNCHSDDFIEGDELHEFHILKYPKVFTIARRRTQEENTVTREEWKKKEYHGYVSTIKKIPYVLKLNKTTGGTQLVPVRILEPDGSYTYSIE